MKNNTPKTEQTLPKEKWIDKLDTKSAIELIINNQLDSVKSLHSASFQIEEAINQITEKIKNSINARLIYLGAGTSGRLGILDGAELPPTFGWDTNRLVFIIAGGRSAMFESSESDEDKKNLAFKEIKNNKVCRNDILIALSASGSTRFTLEGVKQANLVGALTIGIANNQDSKLLKEAQCPIFLDSSIEVVSGSTRLAAGTTQKICLNIISTMVMTKLGKVKNSMMINMKATNKKLISRYKKIKKSLNGI